MTSMAARLSEEVERWGADSPQRQGKEGAPRTFQRAMAARLRDAGGKAGASYRALLGYMNGDSEPSLEWLREACEVLGVRFAWLVAGEGPRTKEGAAYEGAAKEAAKTEADARVWRAEREIALTTKFDFLRGLGLPLPDLSDYPADGHIYDRSMDEEEAFDRFAAWVKFTNASAVPFWAPSVAAGCKHLGVEVEDAGRACRGVLDAVGLDPSEGVDASYRIRPWLNAFVTAMVPVLIGLQTATTSTDESGRTDAEA